MQQVVDYLRANAGHDPSLLVQQLRTAGHDDHSITQAWDLAFPRESSWPRQGHYHAVAGTTEHATTLPSSRSGMPTWVIVAIVAVVMAAAGALVGTMTTLDRGTSDVLDEEVVAIVAEETDVTRSEAKAVLDQVGGARVEGQLPEGWRRLQEGVWGSRRTGSNVLVAVFPVGTGMTLDELVASNVAKARQTTSLTYGEPRRTQLFGHEARALDVTGTIQGTDVVGEQTYLLVGEDMVLVNATYMSEDDRDDVGRVIKQLRLT